MNALRHCVFASSAVFTLAQVLFKLNSAKGLRMSPFALTRATLLAALCFLSACGVEEAERIKPPMVIVISAGDIALEDLGPYGGPIPTPNLDRLAAIGTVFDRAYSASPQIGPARAALVTGQYPQRFGYHFDPGTVRESLTEKTGVPESVVLLPERMQSYGYTTTLFGSWHLGAAPNFYPMFRGYDAFWGTLGAYTSYTRPRRSDTTFVKTKKYRLAPSRSRFNAVFTGQDADTVSNTTLYLTDDMGDQISREISRTLRDVNTQAPQDGRVPRKPLFVWAAFHAPREPLTALSADMVGLEALGSKERQVYGAMVRALDRNIGKLLDTLDRKGALEDTLIIFTADRGCDIATGTCPCGTLRGGAPTFREGGLRVPLIISMPKHFESGGRVSEPVISMDIAKTIIELADPAPRFIPELDGADLTPILKDNTAAIPKRILFWEQFPYSAAVRGDTKILLDGTSNRAKLYDLVNDPSEKTDISELDIYTVSEIETKLDIWRGNNMIPRWEGFKSTSMQVCGRTEYGLR